MPRRKPSFWQFSLVLKIEETGFRIKMAQAEIGNLSDKLNKGTNVIASEQTTERISEINLQLRRRDIDISTALNKLCELVGTKYGKYREQKERQHIKDK
jgi:hypothetical protein